MRVAGALLRGAIDAAATVCVVGATTAEVNAAAERVIRDAAAGGGHSEVRALFLGYGSDGGGAGFPAVACISINDEVVHGIPGRRRIKPGDLVKIDCGVSVDGWCADAAVTVPVEPVSSDRQALVATTRRVLDEAIALVQPGRRWSVIAARMQRIAEDSGLAAVREYVGHGIGRRLHEAPEVPGFVDADRMDRDFTLRPGMTLAIEPMLVMGSPDTVEQSDGWTVVTADGLPSAHFEHTVAVTRDGADVLTAEAIPRGPAATALRGSWTLPSAR